MSTILATYPSRSNPAKTYNVIRGDDGVEYCSCPAWRMQGGDTNNRPPCKHMIEYYTNVASGRSVPKPKSKPQSNPDADWERSLQEASDQLKGLMR